MAPKNNALSLVTEPQKATRTRLDTEIVTPASVKAWALPPFQRELKVNAKVVAISTTIRDTLVVPGVITLGILGGKTYLLDGQHRREAFLMSGLDEGFCDICRHEFDSMADMGRAFVEINSQLVRLKPDDILRGLASSIPALKSIQEKCPFVGFDHVRRNDRSPIVSMSLILKCWCGSATEQPNTITRTAAALAQGMTTDDIAQLVAFLTLAFEAWGRDAEYARLWGSLNLGICMWIYRRMVLTQYSARIVQIAPDLFRKLLMSLSADSSYLDWLVGRQLRDKDRSPGYNKIKAIFGKRIEQETGKKPHLPSPAWAAH